MLSFKWFKKETRGRASTSLTPNRTTVLRAASPTPTLEIINAASLSVYSLGQFSNKGLLTLHTT